MGLFANIRNDLRPLAISSNSSISDAWLRSKYAPELYLSRVYFLQNRLLRLMTIYNNAQSCMSCKTYSIDQTLLNSIFSIIVPAGKYTLKLINSCIKTWFQIFPQITKKAQKWLYSYKSRISLLYLNMFHSLLSYHSRWFRTFICLLEWLLEQPLRSL